MVNIVLDRVEQIIPLTIARDLIRLDTWAFLKVASTGMYKFYEVFSKEDKCMAFCSSLSLNNYSQEHTQSYLEPFQ